MFNYLKGLNFSDFIFFLTEFYSILQIFGLKTVSALFKPLSQYDVGPPFSSHNQKKSEWLFHNGHLSSGTAQTT